MIIREINADETGFLKEMLYEGLYVRAGESVFPKDVVDTPEFSKYISKWGEQENDIAVVAEQKGILVGAAWGRILGPPNAGYGFIDQYTPEISIAVKKEHREKGIGSMLLDELGKRYLEKGTTALSLSVDKQSQARRLYRRKGFAFFTDAGTAVTLKKIL